MGYKRSLYTLVKKVYQRATRFNRVEFSLINNWARATRRKSHPKNQANLIRLWQSLGTPGGPSALEFLDRAREHSRVDFSATRKRHLLDGVVAAPDTWDQESGDDFALSDLESCSGDESDDEVFEEAPSSGGGPAVRSAKPQVSHPRAPGAKPPAPLPCGSGQLGRPAEIRINPFSQEFPPSQRPADDSYDHDLTVDGRRMSDVFRDCSI